jgi:RNA polymerase sigma-70 factor (ECF subfamily)
VSRQPSVISSSLVGADLAAEMRPALLKYFRRKCGNPAEAEDLTQEVLVRSLAHARWGSLEEAKAYIFRSAVNCWHDRLRRRVRQGTPLDIDTHPAGFPNEEITPERVLSVEQELHLVVAALMELGERTRDVFMLVRLENLKQAQIAELLGISVSSVEKHLAKAIAHLARRARIAGRGDE